MFELHLHKPDEPTGLGVMGKRYGGLIECERIIAMKLSEYKEKKFKDPNYVRAYQEVQPELKVIRAIVEARTAQNLTQKELAERTGIAQTEISRLENGSRNPSIKLLQRLAEGMGLVLNISFVPKEE